MSQHNTNYIISKVVYSGETLIDLTADTVTPDKLFSGITAHKADGTIITGTAAVTIVTDGTMTGISLPAGLLTVEEEE